MSSKSVLQECQVRVFYKSGLQECQVRSVVEDCSVCNIKQECVVIRVSRKSVKSECLTRVSLLSVKQECLTRVSSRCSPDLPSETVSMKFDGVYFLGFFWLFVVRVLFANDVTCAKAFGSTKHSSHTVHQYTGRNIIGILSQVIIVITASTSPSGLVVGTKTKVFTSRIVHKQT